MSGAGSSTRRAAAVATGLGDMLLVVTDDGLCRIHLGTDAIATLDDDVEIGALDDDPVLSVTAGQLTGYLAGRVRSFDVPLDRRGLSPFDLAVSDAMRAIPYGRVASYGELAQAVGQPGAARAVGGACNRNPLPIVVPCHRVVASDGTLGGFALGLEAKRRLLEREGAPVLHGGWSRADGRQLRLEPS